MWIFQRCLWALAFSLPARIRFTEDKAEMFLEILQTNKQANQQTMTTTNIQIWRFFKPSFLQYLFSSHGFQVHTRWLDNLRVSEVVWASQPFPLPIFYMFGHKHTFSFKKFCMWYLLCLQAHPVDYRSFFFFFFAKPSSILGQFLSSSHSPD